MLFNSWTFLLFFIIVFPSYFLLNHRKQNWLLLIASYVFYGYWDWRFLGLIAFSTAIDYLCGIKIEESSSPKDKRNFLLLSLFFNLGSLGFFKYWGFFLDSAVATFGIDANILRLDIVLPVGISFYTFQTMSYTIDIYRGKLKACHNLLNYSVFVAFFPQLVAGPIERAQNLLPQIQKQRKFQTRQVKEGFWLILWGLFKKMVVADNLAIIVDRVFENSANASSIECLLAIYAFAYQIYCDFSGYSDIARGLAKLMGIDIIQNFNIPYLSKNPQDFWHRWHIGLSTWLKDYLYIPLGGSKAGPYKTYRNLMLTMILGGLWHGAAWTFVLWGVYQGTLLIIHRFVFIKRKIFEFNSSASNFIATICWFHFVCFGWLIFRANSVEQIGEMSKNIVLNWALTPQVSTMLASIIFLVGVLWPVDYFYRNKRFLEDTDASNGYLEAIVLATIVLLTLVMGPSNMQSFIYFQF